MVCRTKWGESVGITETPFCCTSVLCVGSEYAVCAPHIPFFSPFVCFFTSLFFLFHVPMTAKVRVACEWHTDMGRNTVSVPIAASFAEMACAGISGTLSGCSGRRRHVTLSLHAVEYLSKDDGICRPPNCGTGLGLFLSLSLFPPSFSLFESGFFRLWPSFIFLSLFRFLVALFCSRFKSQPLVGLPSRLCLCNRKRLRPNRDDTSCYYVRPRTLLSGWQENRKPWYVKRKLLAASTLSVEP